MLNFQIPDYNFMKESKIFGDDYFKIYTAKTTDLTILLGGCANNKYQGHYYITVDNYKMNYLIEDKPTAIDFHGELCCISGEYYKEFAENIGIRPCLPYDEIKDKCKIINEKNGILEVEYGEYPQQVPNEEIKKQLEYIYKIEYIEKIPAKYNITNLKITKTGKEYHLYEYQNFTIPEFKYNEKKYICTSCNLHKSHKIQGYTELSNNIEYYNHQNAWIEVQPIKWLVDKKYNMAIAEKILITGIPMEKEWKTENFDKSRIKKFMDNCFNKDIIPSKTEELNIILQPETRNPKIIEAAIEYKPDMNITIKLPEEIINNIEQINIESLKDSNKQFTYVKKR